MHTCSRLGQMRFLSLEPSVRLPPPPPPRRRLKSKRHGVVVLRLCYVHEVRCKRGAQTCLYQIQIAGQRQADGFDLVIMQPMAMIVGVVVALMDAVAVVVITV